MNEYQITIKINLQDMVVETECYAINHTSTNNITKRTIAKVLQVPVNLIADEVITRLTADEKAQEEAMREIREQVREERKVQRS